MKASTCLKAHVVTSTPHSGWTRVPGFRAFQAQAAAKARTSSWSLKPTTSTSELASTSSRISSTVAVPSLNVVWMCRIALPTLAPLPAPRRGEDPPGAVTRCAAGQRPAARCRAAGPAAIPSVQGRVAPRKPSGLRTGDGRRLRGRRLIGRAVDHDLRQDDAVRDHHLEAILGPQRRRTHADVHDTALMVAHADLVADPKWALEQQVDAGEEVLQNVLDGEADGQPEYSERGDDGGRADAEHLERPEQPVDQERQVKEAAEQYPQVDVGPAARGHAVEPVARGRRQTPGNQGDDEGEQEARGKGVRGDRQAGEQPVEQAGHRAERRALVLVAGLILPEENLGLFADALFHAVAEGRVQCLVEELELPVA